MDLKNMNFDKLKSFDWRSLQKYASPKASEDLNHFLEKLPVHAGKTMLIIAGVAWGAAGALGLYTTIQIKQLTQLRTELEKSEAIKPAVPVIANNPVPKEAVTAFVENAKKIYTGLSITANGSAVSVEADSTGAFGQFREAIGHIQNGGPGWVITIEKFCVGRECDGKPLAASLKVNTVSVDKPG